MSADRWCCLLYHDVTSERAGVSGGPLFFAVSRRGFERQLDRIAELGFAGGSLADTLRLSGQRRVAITFDDGDLGQFERAFPALVAHRMTATFFVTTDWVGRRGYVSWEQLREMKGAGMSIQSHSKSHPFLSELGPEQVLDELKRSKEELDQALGQATDAIALPGGDFPRPAARHLFGVAGYSVVATSRWGMNHSPPLGGGVPFMVRRCTVRGEPQPTAFRGVLEGDAWHSLRQHLRETALGALRSSLGPSRYASWRRRFLDAVSPD